MIDFNVDFYIYFMLDVLLQASFHDDIPCEIHSKIHLVDLAGRYVASYFINHYE